MRFDIDVVFLRKSGDGEATVLRCLEGMKPWRLSPMVWKAQAVLELPAGTVQRFRLKEGEELHLWDSV